MKRKCLGVLLFAAILLIAGCGGPDSPNDSNNPDASGDSSSNNHFDEDVISFAPETVIDKDTFLSFYEEVDITADNWSEFFNISEKEDISLDGFGDPIPRPGNLPYDKHFEIRPKDGLLNEYRVVDGIVLRLTYDYNLDKYEAYDIDTGDVRAVDIEYTADFYHWTVNDKVENDYTFSSLDSELCSNMGNALYIIQSGGYVMIEPETRENIELKSNIYEIRYYSISNVECIKCKGKLATFHIDEKYWNKPLEGEKSRYIAVQGDEKMVLYFENGEYGTEWERAATAGGSSPFSWDIDYVK